MLPSGIQDAYFTASKQIIDAFGKNITCYYDNGLTSAETGQSLINPITFDSEGSPAQITSFGGREDQAQPATSSKIDLPTQTVRARVYWEKSQNVIKSLGLNLQEKVCKINCYLTDIPKLKQAQYIEVDSENSPYVKLKAELVRDFIPYGLGAVRYGISYWKVVG